MKVNLSRKYLDFIRQRIDTGGYRNASEVISAGLRLLEQREREDKQKLRTLRRLFNEGIAQIERGDCHIVEPGELDQFMDAIAAKARARAARATP